MSKKDQKWEDETLLSLASDLRKARKARKRLGRVLFHFSANKGGYRADLADKVFARANEKVCFARERLLGFVERTDRPME